MRLIKFLSLLPLAMASHAGAQTAEPPPAKAETAIIVDGRKIQKQASDFVRAITRETSTDQYAQFNAPVCAQVIGYQRAEVETFLTRINLLVQAAGLEIDQPKCKPNIIIVLAPDASALLARMKEEGAARFIKHPYAEAERQKQAAMPVRWWHNISLADASGRRLSSQATNLASAGASDEFTTSGAGGGRAERGGAGTVSSANSLIAKSTAASISTVFVVVNMKLVKGYNLNAVADYSAFVALSQITLGATNPGANTILNLFETPPDAAQPAAALSEWDIAYLSALKKAPRNMSASRQRVSMARNMQKDIEAKVAAQDEPNTSPEAPLPQ
jgi:hypothetical protein